MAAHPPPQPAAPSRSPDRLHGRIEPEEAVPAAVAPPRRARLLALVLASALAVLALPPAEQAHAQQLDEIQRQLRSAAQERAGLERRLEEATAAFDRLQTRIAELEAERDELADQAASLLAEATEIDEVVAARLRETFKHGAALDPLTVFLGSDDPTAALSRAQTVRRVVAVDRVRSDGLLAARTRAAAAQRRVEDHAAQLEEALGEQEALGERLQADFDRAQALEDRLTRAERVERDRLERERREREERERAAAARRAAATTPTPTRSSTTTSTTSSGGGGGGGGGATACPLDGPRSFVDSWGAPRSGGRGHRGTDVMGRHGAPVRAIASGTWVHQARGASAGIWGILRGDNGDHYWYMHLASHTVSSGSRVTAGQQIGTNGTTGNAPPNAPHVHFELHPGGGGAVNPYALLRRVC